MRANQTQAITPIDVLKTIAVITMVVDHAGYYFFPDQAAWRALGRASFPLWLFLVGYAETRELSPRIWAGAAITALGAWVTAQPLVPFNILFTILAVRATLTPLARKIFAREEDALIGLGVLSVLVLPSYPLLEYGSLAWIVALLGYAWRHQDAVRARLGDFTLVVFAVLSVFVVIASELLFFGLMGITGLLAALGMGASLALCAMLLRPQQVRIPPLPASWAFRFCGRRSLEIYVIHLLAFRVLAFFGTAW